jgi:pilus assembly protein CpaB
MKLRALFVSLLASALTVFLLAAYLKRLEIETSGGAPVRVLVAVKPIDPGAVLTSDMVALRSVPQAFVESRAVKHGDLSRVIGLKVETGIKPQQTILWTDLAVASDDRRQLSALVQPGMRAVGIRSGSGDRYFANIRPGDRVDVVANVPGSKDDKDRLAVLVAQNVLVLAVGLDTGGGEVAARAPATDRGELVLTVGVNMQQLQQISLAQERGKLTVGLRNPDDARPLEGVSDMSYASIFAGAPEKKDAPAPIRPTALVAPQVR